ncbi:hypothetical protein FHG87_020092 [Trinorchestia longiramus]|nr:hypothetical protein FHG87_020092 [Trinorchestia longiramus]
MGNEFTTQCTVVYTQGSSGGSLGTTPPPHTPPEVPGFLLPPEGIIITQPTPDVETFEEAIKLKQDQEDEAKNKENKENEKEHQKADEEEKQVEERKAQNEEKLEKGEKNERYQRQFSSSPDSESTAAPPLDEPPTKPSYDELISSPDASAPDAENTAKGHPPPPGHKKPPRPSTQKGSDEGLGVAEIVITAATPMAENSAPATNKAAPQSADSIDVTDGNHSDADGEAMLLDDDDHPPPPPPAPSGGGTSGIEERRREEDEAVKKEAKNFKVKAGNSIELSTDGGNGAKSPTPSEGPPDLDLDKLKDLDRLKESDA